MKHTKLRRHMNSAQIIILGFAALHSVQVRSC